MNPPSNVQRNPRKRISPEIPDNGQAKRARLSDNTNKESEALIPVRQKRRKKTGTRLAKSNLQVGILAVVFGYLERSAIVETHCVVPTTPWGTYKSPDQELCGYYP